MPVLTNCRLSPPPSDLPGFYTFLIPTFNRAGLLARALASIQRLTPVAGVDVELLVVDNNSTDSTSSVCAASQGRYPVSRIMEPRQGLNYARNRGWREAKGDFLVYLDDDMEVAQDWLVACHAGLSSKPAHAVCGPVQPRFESVPAAWVAGELMDSVTSSYSRRGNEVHLIASASSHQLPGCNFGVWRSVLCALGGFHPDLDRSGSGMLAGGDTEFGRRMVAAGGTTLYIPGCSILHFVSDAKISFRGLEQRWLGLGRTQRAIKALSGESVPAKARMALVRRILGNLARAGLAMLRNDRREAALQWMHAARNWGMLTYDPSNLRPVLPGGE